MGRLTGVLAILFWSMLPGCDSHDQTDASASARPSTRVERLHETDWKDRQTLIDNLDFLESAKDEAQSSKSLRDGYVHAVGTGIAQPLRADLTTALGQADGKKFAQEYNDLKLFLLLHDPGRSRTFSEWVTDELTRRAATALKLEYPHAQLRGVVDAYVSMLGAGYVDFGKMNRGLVSRARDTLARQRGSTRVYDQFVTALEGEKIDPSGPDALTNFFYPPLTLGQTFADRPDVLKVMRSKRYRREKKWQKIRGPYTKKGYLAVSARLAEARKDAIKEAWVIPAGQKFEAVLDRVWQDYQAQYIKEWLDFLRDTEVIEPTSPQGFIDLAATLLRDQSPVVRLILLVEEHSQFARVDTGKAAAKDPIRARFAPMVAFALASAGQAVSDTPFSRYQTMLSDLRATAIELRVENPDAELDKDAVRKFAEETRALIAPPTFDGFREILAQWLLAPSSGSA
jgi:type VI protein secretion system component VasK